MNQAVKTKDCGQANGAESSLGNCLRARSQRGRVPGMPGRQRCDRAEARLFSPDMGAAGTAGRSQGKQVLNAHPTLAQEQKGNWPILSMRFGGQALQTDSFGSGSQIHLWAVIDLGPLDKLQRRQVSHLYTEGHCWGILHRGNVGIWFVF